MAQITSTNFVPMNGALPGQYYKHSGHVNVPGVVSALIVGLLAGAVMGVIYAAGVVFIPLIKLRIILTLAFGFGLGVVPAVLLRKFKVRNSPVSMAVAGVVTLVSFYVCWVAWESLLLRNEQNPPSFVRLLTHPVIVYRVAEVAEKFGTWSMGGSEAVNGTSLLTIWAIETACIFGASLLVMRGMVDHLPFCEKCDRWCEAAKVVKQSEPNDAKILKSKLEAGDFKYAAGLPRPTTANLLEFSVQKCGKCNDLNTLTVVSRSITRDKKGKTRKNKTKTIVKKLLVAPADVALLSSPAPAQMAVPAAPVVPVKAASVRKPIKSPQAM